MKNKPEENANLNKKQVWKKQVEKNTSRKKNSRWHRFEGRPELN